MSMVVVQAEVQFVVFVQPSKAVDGRVVHVVGIERGCGRWTRGAASQRRQAAIGVTGAQFVEDLVGGIQDHVFTAAGQENLLLAGEMFPADGVGQTLEPLGVFLGEVGGLQGPLRPSSRVMAGRPETAVEGVG